MNTAVDTNAILRSFLVDSTGSSLYGLVGTGVYSPRLPKEIDGSTTACIAFNSLGGNSLGGNDVTMDPSFQIRCYGGSYDPIDAHSVYLALHERLHGAHNSAVTGGVLMAGVEEMQGQDLTEPDTLWPVVVTFYRVICRST